ncbi:phage tail protein [Paramagnetospirillum magneticum]|nr:phage tail protein [Paramagnetospirillum magneticum]
MAPTGPAQDPFRTFRFVVEVEGIQVGGFSSVNGLQSKIEYHTQRQGGVNTTEYRLGGQVTYSELTLEAGLTLQDPMWTWYEAATKGQIKRKNGTISLQDAQGQLGASWNFFNAWPVEWQGPALDAAQSLVATQRFVLVHEGITKSGGDR